MKTQTKSLPICSKCETGKKEYELDKTSPCCSHIQCLHNGKCPYYTSLKH